MTKVAVVGSGYWGKNLVRNFHDLGNLAAICDTDPDALARLKEQYPGVPVVGSYDDVLHSTELDIDAIVIATPAETHASLARRAIHADKHVFVEKPLALDVREGAELVRLAEERNRTLMVGHVLQFHAAVRKLKALIDDGTLGKIHYVYSNRLNMGKIRTEENILWSFAPHDISVMLMLLNEFPQEVSSRGGNYLQPAVADVTMTSIGFPSGVRGHIFVSWLHPFKEQKLVVVGDRRMAVFDDVSEDKLCLYPHSVEWRDRQPVAVKAQRETVNLELTEPLRGECQHFLECIASGAAPWTDGREGLRVLQVLSACEQSLQHGGQAVRLDEADDPSSAPSVGTIHPGAFVHETAVVDGGATIGDGTKVWHFSHVLPNTKIGPRCSLGQNVMVGPDVQVGSRCKIQNNVSIYKGVTLEDDVFCGPSMVFTNVYNPRAAIVRMNELRPTLVKRGVTIGANATIVCGTTLGEYAFIGAGATVIRDVQPYALMVGTPARRIGWMCECGIALDQQLECNDCGRSYVQVAAASDDDDAGGEPRIEPAGLNE